MAAADETGGLLEELRAGGELDSRGRFTLDRAQARAKMQKFQLVDARRYVLELVQAATLRGATAIVFDIDADDMRMRFDGHSFTGEELGELWGSIFADGDERPLRGLRQLALGLNAALGLGPRRITLRSGGHQLVLRPGAEEVMTAIEPPATGTAIHVEQRVRLGLLVAFIKNIGGRLGEEVHLRERCAHTAVAVSLDGVTIAGGLRVAGALAQHEFAGPGVRGAIALVAGEPPATLRLIKDGVWIDTLPLEHCGPGIVAVVEGERLRRDVSLAKVVADEALAELVGQVRAQRWELMGRLVEAAQSGQLPAAPTMARVEAEALQFLRLRDLRKRPEVAIVAAALRWPEARTGTQTPGWVTLAELAALAEARRAAGRAAVGAEADSADGEDEDGDADATIRKRKGAEIRPADGEDEDGGQSVEIRKRKLAEIRPVIGYALKAFPELAPEGAGVAVLPLATAEALGRILGCTMEFIDAALTQASARAQARRAWLRRTMPARLPDDRRYLLRAPIAAEGLRGELGVAATAAEASPRAEGTTWLLREGCLLTRMTVAWGVPGLDVVLAGSFTPGELYEDVVGDAALVRAALQTIAALQEPLAALVLEARGGALEGPVRGLVKAWLSLVLDVDAREGLWEALKVAPALRPDALAVQAVLPSPAQLRAGEGSLAVFLQVPLFADFDGSWRSLDAVARRQTGRGLAELAGGAAPDPSLGRELARLDRGERKLLAALLGGAATWSLWVPSMAGRRRARKFWSQPAETMEAVATRMQAELRAAGIDPSLWSRRIQAEGIEGILLMAHASVPPGVEPRAAQIEVRFEGRTLLTRSFELGIWPIVGAVAASGLAPGPEWQDVEDEAAMAAVVTVLRAEAWALAAGLLLREREGLSRWRWVAAPLLLRLAEPDGDDFAARQVPGLTGLPLLHTLAGGALSVDEVAALLRERGRIEWVPPDTATIDLGAPPVLRETVAVVAALRERFGAERVVEGAERLRARARADKLAGLPTVEKVALERSQVWEAVPLATDGQKGVTGEVGLARLRTTGGLSLVLCVRGKQVGVCTQADFPAPVEAIVADDELPLDAQGVVDQRSKRYGQHVRRCRRAVADLIVRLCADYGSTEGARRDAARALLLAYAGERIEQVAKGSVTTDRGLDAVRKVALVSDVTGELRSLAEIEAMGRVDAVGPSAAAPVAGLELDRPVLRVDAAAERCLAGMKVRRIDDRWERELAALAELTREPRYQLPDLAAVAWVERKVTIAGGLQAQLWIARGQEEQALVFTRAGREVGRLQLIAALPCSGVVQGEGLIVGETVELEARQRSSLGKQICMLYEALAKQVKAGRFPAAEREPMLARLAQVDAALAASTEPLMKSIGKPLAQLQAALAGIVSPALRSARAREQVSAARAVAEARASEANAARARAEILASEASAARARAEALAREASTARAKAAARAKVEVQPAVAVVPAIEPTPEQRLLAALREELGWARARHGSLLDTLGLDRLAIGEGAGSGIAVFDAGIVLQRRHPLVERILRRLGADGEIDAIDLMFVVSTVYTLMNEVAEAIDAEDERAFVARMAESLALGLAVG